jgi:hypothetical protein
MSIFSVSQKHQLKNVLGEHYAALLPLLEEAARPVDGPRAPWEHRTEVKAQKKAAAQLIRASQRFIRALETAQDAVPEALRQQYVPSDEPGGVDSWESWSRARCATEDLLHDATIWNDRATEESRLRRGRKVSDRRVLAEWIGLKMSQGGITLTISADGQWARTVQIVCDAAKVTTPIDLFRDIQSAYRYLQTQLPERFPSRSTRR